MTRTLWQPDIGAPRNSIPESNRVRGLYMTEKGKHLDLGEHPQGHGARGTCKACGKFRGDFARDIVRVCLANELHVPGQDSREPLREGETQIDRYVDAARTRVRQFEKGRAETSWVLCAIETTIADRWGMAYPPCAYQNQEAFPID